MGRRLAETYTLVKETFSEADDILGIPLSTLSFDGPEEELTQTVNTQPALVATSVAIARLLQDKGLAPDGVAGHSLGEYSALVVSGALTFADALTTVRLRGRLMQEAAPDGTMAAIIGLDGDTVRQLCEKVEGIVEPATYNGPGQIVVAGQYDAVEKIVPLAQEAGARRVALLNVSGPFHSSLLRGAGEELGKHLEGLEIRQPRFPVVSNVTGEVYTDADQIKQCLRRQVSEAVLWEQSIRHLIQLGFQRFIEVGPGRVLSGLIRRIERKTTLSNVESPETLDELLQ